MDTTMDTYGYYNGYIWILQWIQWIQPAPNVYYADAMPDVEALMQVCILVLFVLLLCSKCSCGDDSIFPMLYILRYILLAE
jgi:hypothetical protein